MRPRITTVSPEGDFRLHLAFSDGSSGTVDLQDQIVGRGGVFEALERADVFRQVRADRESGTIVWPNGVDLDPDVLYSLATGRPLPGSSSQLVEEPPLSELVRGGAIGDEPRDRR
jgi:hypothetical protein